MVGIPCIGNEGRLSPVKKATLSINIVLISLFYLLQLGSTYSYSQEPKFIIRLKSGVEIKAEKIAIEDDVVFYLFSSNEEKRMGISKGSVAEIVERGKRSGKEIIIFPQKTDLKNKSTR
ncbi:MAG: hypothetical protein PVH02_03560 [Desulfobacteraceae bacterium]